MIEIILLGIAVAGIIILVYQNLKKNKTKSNSEEGIGELTKINSGIDDLKTRTQNIENLFSGGPRAIGVVGETHMFALIKEILSSVQYIKNQKINTNIDYYGQKGNLYSGQTFGVLKDNEKSNDPTVPF